MNACTSDELFVLCSPPLTRSPGDQVFHILQDRFHASRISADPMRGERLLGETYPRAADPGDPRGQDWRMRRQCGIAFR